MESGGGGVGGERRGVGDGVRGRESSYWKPPNSLTVATAASMAACPDPLTAMVKGFWVWKAYWRKDLTSSMTPRNSGCICEMEMK